MNMRSFFLLGFLSFINIESIGSERFNDRATIQKILEQSTDFSRTSANQHLKFISYNVQMSGLDEVGHVWVDRKHAVATMLAYSDVFVLQEVTHEQLIDLQGMLTDFELVGVNISSGRSLLENASNIQEGLVIGFRKVAFKLVTHRIMWYSDTPQIPSKKWGDWASAFIKAVHIAELSFIKNNKKIMIFNSHFAHDEDPSGEINPRVLSSAMEIEMLKQLSGTYWISAGDRNFHYPRDIQAYNNYKNESCMCDSRYDVGTHECGSQSTFIGYEAHPRVNPLMENGDFEKPYYLDVIFHNRAMMKSAYWVSHMGEYDNSGNLLPFDPCKNMNQRLFASDHTAIFVLYNLENFN